MADDKDQNSEDTRTTEKPVDQANDASGEGKVTEETKEPALDGD